MDAPAVLKDLHTEFQIAQPTHHHWRREHPGERSVHPGTKPPSFIDGPLALVGMPWSKISDCYFYATEEHVKGPVLKHLASRHNIILMERHNLKNSILKMAEVLKQGKNIMIFP